MNAVLERLVATHPPSAPVQLLVDEVDWFQPTRKAWYARLYTPCNPEVGGYYGSLHSRSAHDAARGAIESHERLCRCSDAGRIAQRYAEPIGFPEGTGRIS